ncbi:MAG: RNA polymerase-binding protein RbpA [Propionibacteriaceae bacterium]
MASNSGGLRGSGLGSKSLQDETGVEFAARQEIGFSCPKEHAFFITFSAEAELPLTWECPRCGELSERLDGTRPEESDQKPVRTHWDMLRERRSVDELEELLQERLAELRENNHVIY